MTGPEKVTHNQRRVTGLGSGARLVSMHMAMSWDVGGMGKGAGNLSSNGDL